MNVIKIDINNQLMIDNKIIENWKMSTSGTVLIIEGNQVEYDFSMSKLFDKDVIEKVRPEFVKKGRRSRPYVEGWYQLKETKRITFTSTNFCVWWEKQGDEDVKSA